METAPVWTNRITLYVNGVQKSIVQADPRTTLIQYLRSVGLTGTKLGCGEGGCGACTVMLSHFDNNLNAPKHISANACLTPLCSLDGFAVTTIEGIGGMKQGLHPVQSRLAKLHGSQCGFCTPGIVMSLYTQLRNNPMSTPHEIEECMDGNLCRCTGYRPILDAAKSLSNSKPCCSSQNSCSSDNCCATKKAESASNGCCGGGGAGGGCPCKEQQSKNEAGEMVIFNSTEATINSNVGLSEEMAITGHTEPIFPPALFGYTSPPLQLDYDKYTWYQPSSLAQLLALKSENTNARLIVGNTEVGIETRFKNMDHPIFINPSHIPELNVLKVTEREGKSGLLVGASVTINSLQAMVKSLERSGQHQEHQLRGLVAIKHMLAWFASNQIRNVASVAGNIVTASPISDLNPVLMACDAVLQLTSISGNRQVNINNFFLSYRCVDLQSDEILEHVFIPFTTEFEFVIPLKQGRRREDDISIVTAGIRVRLSPCDSNDHWVVQDCAMAFGGMAPVTKSASKSCAVLLQQPWHAESFEAVYQSLRQEFDLPENVPGGQAEYRMSLATSFVFRSFLMITDQLQTVLSLGDSALPSAPVINSREKSAINNFVTSEKQSSRGEQTYSMRSGGLCDSRGQELAEQVRAPVGEPLMHKSAHLQVTGEAKYTGDVALPSSALHAHVVTSTRAHARILSVDTAPAEASEGYVAYFCAKDVLGTNHIGAVIKDEEVFATEFVTHYGAVIGVVLCETHQQAMAAAKKVVITYEDLPTVVSIEEAIQAQSFYPTRHEIASGDLDAQIRDADIVVEGSGNIGSQEHFYLETNCTVITPLENGHLEIMSSTQNPYKTQHFCAAVCGLPASRVVAKCKRMGGGFGGKETRSVFTACTAALAAHILQRTVSINIERDLDMSITGQRHAFFVKYRAGCDRAGKLKFMDATLYSNGGFSMDLSQPVMDRALFHSDNVYKWPALRVNGIVCQTNQPSHTAFRGFGGPQGMMMTEMIMTHLARAAKIPDDLFREQNFYTNGDRTNFGQVLEGFHVPKIWNDIRSQASFAEREAAVVAFNKEQRWKKRGICLLPTKFGINFTAKFMNQGGALVHVYSDSTVLVAHGGTEMGQGLHTKMIQIAARCFGISDDCVHVAETATNTVANSSPTAASMSTDLYGMAVLDACEQIMERLKPIRAGMPESCSWCDLVTSAYFQRVDLSAHGYYAVPTDRCGYDWDMACTDNSQRGMPFNYFTQAVACCETEIDCLTGDSTVLRVDITMDIGKSINPALDIGQIEGAFVQGCGWSTMEELVWGDTQHSWVRPGQLFTRGPGTYKIPSFNDVPLDFRVHLTDTENKVCVHSSKAVGEPPLFLGCSAFFAIQNAVAAAREEVSLLEFFPLHHPATSERIRMACVDQFSSLSTNNNTGYYPKGSW